MAVRYFNHLGFIGGMPVESTGRKRWAATGQVYARRAGLLSPQPGTATRERHDTR
jgi:hypothetical protein